MDMNFHQLAYCVGFTAVGVLGGCMDLRKSHIIPNWLTYAGVLGGLTSHLILDGWHGLLSSFFACVLGFLFMLPFYLKKGTSGGDVKLVVAICAFAALPYLYPVIFWTCVSALVIGVGYVIATGYLKTSIANVFELFRHTAVAPLAPHPELNVDNPSLRKVPHGAGMAVGCVIAFAVALSQAGAWSHSRSNTHRSVTASTITYSRSGK